MNREMIHPLGFVTEHLRVRVFLLFFGVMVVFFLLFLILDGPIHTSAAPIGIVSFELAGSVEKAREMMASWDENARIFVAFSLGFDFLFMPVYAITLSLGALLVEGRRKRKWLNLGRIAGWGVFVATIFDSIENTALFTILRGYTAPPYPQVAFICACIKFSLLIIGIVYGLVGWLFPEKK